MKRVDYRVRFDENSFGQAIFVTFCKDSKSYKLLIIRDIDGQLIEKMSEHVKIVLQVP